MGHIQPFLIFIKTDTEFVESWISGFPAGSAQYKSFLIFVETKRDILYHGFLALELRSLKDNTSLLLSGIVQVCHVPLLSRPLS